MCQLLISFLTFLYSGWWSINVVSHIIKIIKKATVRDVLYVHNKM